MRLLTLLVVLLIIVVAVLVWYALSLRRRINGLEEPVLWLPLRERRRYARGLLEREQERRDMAFRSEKQQYEFQVQQNLIDFIEGKAPSLDP